MSNRVKARCQKEEYAKFYYTSQTMFFCLKAARVFLYAVAVIPIILTLIPSVSTVYAFVCSLVSFGLSILNEALSSFLNGYKKKAIMEYQLYETGITGSHFSKIEYDRETTNDLNELAIRKGISQVRAQEKLYTVEVPDEISDDYSYLYLCRKSAATTNYLLSRIFYIYFFALLGIAAIFIVAMFFKQEMFAYLTLIITFYPVVSPIIKACGKCKECMKDCVKICADIDNYFADGDISLERLARMYYYVQNLEFEMMLNRPVIFNVFKKLFKTGTQNLEEGVTARFEAAIVELKSKSMMQKGIISQPKGKALITVVDYDMDRLTKIAKKKKQKNSAHKSPAPSDPLTDTEQEAPQETPKAAEKEPTKETPKVVVKEPPKETPKATEKEPPKEMLKAAEKEPPKEMPKAAEKEPPKETPKAAEKESPKETPKAAGKPKAAPKAKKEAPKESSEKRTDSRQGTKKDGQ